jgi:transketolase
MRKAALAAIAALLDHNESVIFVGSDLGAGTLTDVKVRHPGRVLMEGIAEQHLVGFAAGLALEGYVPYVHTIGTFLTRRALEQVIIDVALHNLPVRLVASGGGMVYAPLGPTHQAIDDFALMRAIPNMIVVAPADPIEMTQVIEDLATHPGPAYIRVAKGGEPDITSDLPRGAVGAVRPIRKGDGIAVITTGSLLHECIPAVASAAAEGLNPALVHVPYVAPLDIQFISEMSRTFNTLLVVEEHLPSGGLSSAIADVVASGNGRARVVRMTLPAEYASGYGTQRDHWENAGLNASRIAEAIAQHKRKGKE